MQNKDVPVMYISTVIKKKQAIFLFFSKFFALSGVILLTNQNRAQGQNMA